METLEDLSNLNQTIDLRENYPLAIRSIFRQAFAFIIVAIAATVGYIYLQSYWVGSLAGSASHVMFDGILDAVFYTAIAMLAIRLIYDLLFFLSFRYAIELEHLIISKGVILKTRASFPIAKINDVYLHRDLPDFLFGLYQLKVLTPSPVAYLGSVEGLCTATAIRLQNHILALIETTLPEVQHQPASELMDVPTPVNDQAKFLHDTGGNGEKESEEDREGEGDEGQRIVPNRG